MGSSKVKINDPIWYRKSMFINVDRIGVLSIVGAIVLALGHPKMPKTTRRQLTVVGRALASALLADGIILPDPLLEEWERTLHVEVKPFMASDLDAVYVGEDGHPWK